MSEDPSILNDKIACVAYDKKSKVLIAGTKEGRVLFWKNLMIGSESPQESEQWKVLPFMSLDRPVLAISVGKGNGILVVRTSDTIKIISQT
jgi:intraflagellar transport protein 140